MFPALQSGLGAEPTPVYTSAVSELYHLWNLQEKSSKDGAPKYIIQERKVAQVNVIYLIKAIQGFRGRSFKQGFGISSPQADSYTNLPCLWDKIPTGDLY